MGEFIKIYEEDDIGQTWLQDVLDDRNIVYKVIEDGYWTGMKFPVYHTKICVYVDAKDKDLVRKLIDEYNNPESIVQEEHAEVLEGLLPQITCPSCGRECDFDYSKCPNCNFTL